MAHVCWYSCAPSVLVPPAREEHAAAHPMTKASAIQTFTAVMCHVLSFLAMGRLPVLLLLIVAACGGAQVPTHNGYKGGPKAQPWKKAKSLKFDEKSEAKVEGELSYPEKRRAAWFAVDLVSAGQLDLKLEIVPPGESTNEEFDLGFEVLDAGYRTIARSDLQEGDDTGEIQKSKSLLDLEPGRYLVHLYLQGRMDTCDYVLRAVFKPMSTVGKSDFPAQVSFPQNLPMVPLTDDTPKSYKPPTPTTVVQVKKVGKKVTPVKEAPPPPAATITARIINMQVSGSSTQITIGRGTSAGVNNGMKGKIVGVPTGSFTTSNCNERTCTAVVAATPDQIKGSGSVVLTP